MIRTLLLSSIIFATGQTAALPVLQYADIQQELAGLKQEIKPSQVLSVIETNLSSNLVSLSSTQKTLLIQDLEELKSYLCKQERPGLLRWPLGITAGVGLLFLGYWDIASKKQELMCLGVPTITQDIVDVAWDNTRIAFGWLLASLLVMTVMEAEYTDKIDICFAQERNIEQRINNIIVLLKQ